MSKGGMGAVYRARDVQLDRWVAVKCLLDVSKETSRELAAKEARTLASLNHRNIMRVFDILQAGDQVWIVSEWLDGKSLAQVPLPLPPACVLAIMAQVYDALAAAHAAQVIHRDVKPANIIVGVDGRVTLIDFGVAFAPGSSTGETLVGSLRYTDPRILEGETPDAGSDLFSAALLQVELMTGETVLPDLAPLPLYRHIKKALRTRLDALLDGTYPPLAELAGGMLKRFDRASGAKPSTAAQAAESAAKALALLRRVTPLAPEQYLANTLCRGQVADAQAETVISLELEEALVDPTLTPRQKAPWYAFRSHRNATPVEIVRESATFPPKSEVSAKARLVRQSARHGGGRRKNDANLQGRRLFWTVAGAVALAFVAALAGKHRIPAPATNDSAGKNEALPLEEFVPPPSVPPTQLGFEGPPAGARPGADIARGSRGSDGQMIPDAPGGSGATPGRTTPAPATPPATEAPARPELVPLHLAANGWAVVKIDGKEVGKLPQAAPFMLAPGKHHLRLENPSVEPLTAELSVAPGTPQKRHYSLRPKAAPRTIKVGIPGRLFVDGVDHGVVSSKTLTLSYGTHEVSIKRGNRVVKQKRVALGPDSPRDIVVE